MDREWNPELEDELEELFAHVPHETVIADDKHPHVIDNGATAVIADYPPVYAGDMANSTESIDIDAHGLGGGGFETPAEPDVLEQGRDEQVIGAGGDYVRGALHERSIFRDDFVDRMHQQAKAGIGPRGEVLDEFDQRFQEQRGEHAQLVEQADFARINPPSVLQAILGGQATLSLDPNNVNVPDGNVEAEVAFWNGPDAETTPVTVTFGPISVFADAIGKAVPPGPIRAYGVVSFGTRGFLFPVRVDIGQGTQFTVSGSQVRVRVGLEPSLAGLGVPDPVNLTGMLSFHPVIRTKPVTCTVWIDKLGTGTNDTEPVPNYGKDLLVVLSDPTKAVTVSFLDSQGNTITSVSATGFQTVPYPLPADTAAVKVANASGTSLNIALQYGLEL